MITVGRTYICAPGDTSFGMVDPNGTFNVRIGDYTSTDETTNRTDD